MMNKKVLFVCIENSCRSQMAEGLARHLGRDIIDAYSAGSKPKGEVNADAVKVMREIGIDISLYKSKGFEDLPIKKFDVVITLGCKDTCPFFAADKHVEWKIEDPKGKNIEFFRKTRDQLKKNISSLLETLR